MTAGLEPNILFGVMAAAMSSVKRTQECMDIFSLQKKYMEAIDSWDGFSLWLLTSSISEKEDIDLYNMFPKNKKTKYKRVCNSLEA